MRKLLTYMMVIAFLAMNVVTTAHADCVGSSCDAIEATYDAVDTDKHDNDQKTTSCDYCMSCGHHHHAQAFLHSDAGHFVANNSGINTPDKAASLSALQYPPARPPRA